MTTEEKLGKAVAVIDSLCGELRLLLNYPGEPDSNDTYTEAVKFLYSIQQGPSREGVGMVGKELEGQALFDEYARRRIEYAQIARRRRLKLHAEEMHALLLYFAEVMPCRCRRTDGGLHTPECTKGRLDALLRKIK